jgi:hypothetical protein
MRIWRLRALEARLLKSGTLGTILPPDVPESSTNVTSEDLLSSSPPSLRTVEFSQAHQQWQLWLVGMSQSSGDINQSPLSPWGNNKYGQSSHKHIWVTWSDTFALNLPSCNGSLHHFHSTQQVNETHMLDESVSEMEKLRLSCCRTLSRAFMVVIQSRWTGLKLCRLHQNEALPKGIPDGS